MENDSGRGEWMVVAKHQRAEERMHRACHRGQAGASTVPSQAGTKSDENLTQMPSFRLAR